MKRLLQGAPIISGPSNVESYREAVANGELLTTSHDGYLATLRRDPPPGADGCRRTARGSTARTRCRRRRAAGSRATTPITRCAFICIPSVKASRLRDARGVMLVLPNRDVWTFEALDDKVELEDSVFLAGNDGPRRTAQIVIRQDARQASSIRWSFVRSTTSAAQTTARRNARREPELPL